jgi:minichromosome maintenance protein 10
LQEAGHAKALAILTAKAKGIAKADPNSGHRAKGREEVIKEKVKKRMRSDEEETPENAAFFYAENSSAKKAKKEASKTVTVFGKEVSVDKLEEIRNKKSANSRLAEEAELEAADRYFSKAEVKDAMELKMLATTSIKVKAVTCHLCNYTSFKASDLCRDKGHKVKVIDAKKRFFACGDCKQRTVSLDRLPKECCPKCGGSRWEQVIHK